jgi:hypothetical protein
MTPASDRIGALRYCLVVIATALSLAAAVAGFNRLVDPFGMYHDHAINGFNAYKPAMFNRVRLHKAFELRWIRPEAIVLGTSRTHIGIGCSHPGWGPLGKSCYNLAFDGATTREMYEYLVHANAIRPLRRVVLGLDTYHAAPGPSFVRPDFDPLVLRGAALPGVWYLVAGDVRLLASLETLSAAIDTVRAQSDPEPSWFAPDGQRVGEVFFHRPLDDFMLDGPRAYFETVDRLEVGFQTEGAAEDRDSGGAVSVEEQSSLQEQSSLAYIRRIVEFCRQHDIALSIFITPSHAHQLEIAAATGAWAAIEEGKRALALLLDQDAREHPARAPIALFDFALYSSVTTEPLPPAGSRSEMQYYWDSSHFKAIVGDWVLDRVLGVAAKGRSAPPDFGIQLTPRNVDAILSRERLAQAAYRRRCAQELAPLRELVRSKLASTSIASADAPARP